MGPPVVVNASIPQLATAEALKSAFPSTLALQLFHHFCNSACRVLVTMGNNGPQKNPILSLCTPQRLLDMSSAAAAALRMSMLSTSVAHLENELTLRERRKDRQGPFAQIKQQLHEVGQSFKTAALANIVLVEQDEGDQCESSCSNVDCMCLKSVADTLPAQNGSRHHLGDFSHHLDPRCYFSRRLGGKL